MSRARFAVTVAVAFLVSEIAATILHGFVLDADYAPFRGVLLRADAGWQMALLPVAHLSFVIGLVYVYPRLGLLGSHVARGAKLGLLGWLMGQAPLWLIWYAEQPWPGMLVVKQLLLELAAAVLLGVVVAFVARMPAAEPAARRVSA